MKSQESMGKLAKQLNHIRSRSTNIQRSAELTGTKDIDENRLIKILNDYWSGDGKWWGADFGYPIHEDVRIPSSVAEKLRTES